MALPNFQALGRISLCDYPEIPHRVVHINLFQYEGVAALHHAIPITFEVLTSTICWQQRDSKSQMLQDSPDLDYTEMKGDPLDDNVRATLENFGSSSISAR